LKVTDAKGCKMDTLVYVVCRKTISSILTVNGDHVNDVWVVGYAQRFPQVKVLIYNRWGNLVYVSQIPYEDDWDGRTNVGIDQAYVPTGTYFYQIYKTPDSIPETGFIEVLK
jgi:gliding motility-associated-like protein